MSNETHTPGKLHLVGSLGLGFTLHGTLPNGSDTFALAVVQDDGISREANEANARRLVACWNACLDIHDPKPAIDELRSDRAKLRQDKAELVAALSKEVAKCSLCKGKGVFMQYGPDRKEVNCDWCAEARALIAKHT